MVQEVISRPGWQQRQCAGPGHHGQRLSWSRKMSTPTRPALPTPRPCSSPTSRQALSQRDSRPRRRPALTRHADPHGDRCAGQRDAHPDGDCAARGTTANGHRGPSLTAQVSGSSDDVYEDGTSFGTGDANSWLGNAGSTSASFTGLRFAGLNIPQGASITSARLRVYSTQSQWVGLEMTIAAQAADNAPTFSSTSRPSARPLTVQQVRHNSDTQWAASTWYTLDEMAPVVQEVISRPGWQSGNALALVIKGNGVSWSRKIANAYEAGAANVPTLLITYQSAGPVATSTRTPTTVPVGATPTATATATSGASTADTRHFEIGQGFADVTSRQIVRVQTGRVYTFAASGPNSAVLNVVYTRAAGYPLAGATSAAYRRH